MRMVADQLAGRSWQRRLVLVVLSLLLLWSYAFFASFGSREWVTHSVYADHLAEGFRAGHLYLPFDPPQVLLAQENPFAHHLRPLWLWDASLHNGKYYIYWGPLPAVVLAVTKVFFGIPSNVAIGDQYPAYAFACVTFLCFALLIDELARRLFSAPLWLSACAILVLGYANPMPFTLTRGAIYELAILSGQAFLGAGMLCAARALLATEQDRKRTIVGLLGAGVCWAGVLACRLSLAPVIALLVLATALAAAPRPWTLRRLIPSSVQVGVPVALGMVALLAYNYARFGSWLDFGLDKQLSTTPYKANVRHVLPNVYSYLFRPYDGLCRFPFMQSLSNYGEAFPASYQVPEGHLVEEPVVGVFLTIPWLGFALYAVYELVRALWALRRPAARAELDQNGVVRLWVGFCALAMGTVGMFAALGLFLSTMRYLVDIRQGFLLLGTVGAFQLYERCRDRVPRRLVASLIALCAAYSIATGVLLGFDGYYRQFAARNPELYGSLAQRWSFCSSP